MARRAGTASWLSLAGIAQAVGIALIPKCPACLAMHFGVLGSLLAAFQTRLAILLWPSFILGAAGAITLASRRWRSAAPAPSSGGGIVKRIRPCCAPGVTAAPTR